MYDLDQDGYSFADGDCDDNNGWANPGLDELCDGFDNNCNGEVDENLSNCDLDSDPDAADNSEGGNNVPKDIDEAASCSTAQGPLWSIWLLILGFVVPRRSVIKSNSLSS